VVEYVSERRYKNGEWRLFLRKLGKNVNIKTLNGERFLMIKIPYRK
jgi:hypothetical protein